MSITLATDPNPMHLDQQGVLRIGGTRVTLDTVMQAYFDGSSPEEIALRYDSLSLADIHATLAYYLRRKTELDQYLKARQLQSQQIRQHVEQRQGVQHIRERLNARSKN
jgi:uncharacterized protein (DUF433 family)